MDSRSSLKSDNVKLNEETAGRRFHEEFSTFELTLLRPKISSLNIAVSRVLRLFAFFMNLIIVCGFFLARLVTYRLLSPGAKV